MSGKTPYYIQGIGNISPQGTFDNTEFLNEVKTYTENVLTCITPEFKGYINPVQLRRMSRMFKIGLTAAKICAQDARLDMPDAIITSSGYGCIGDTSKFLHEITDNGEKQLTPTLFMQSTYNSISGGIAMAMKCNNYNTTYVHRGFAFETALQDAMMQIEDQPAKRILLGGFDETDKDQFAISVRTGYHRREPVNSLSLFQSPGLGTLQGEGAAFFAISGEKTDRTYAKLGDIKMIYAPTDALELIEAIQQMLLENDLSTKDINVVINGIGGDIKNDALSNEVIDTMFATNQQAVFKHLCGEYCTASAFGMWLGVKMLYHQVIPEIVKINHIHQLNHFRGKNYGLILLHSDGNNQR
jgi:3-oxoacyl-[acyl-carrier-protein] synthase II